MNDAPEEYFCERVTLYALGALAEPDAAGFEEHLVGGCRVCQNTLGSLTAVIDNLALSVEPADPPQGARATLLQRAATRQSTVRASTGRWKQAMPGVLVKEMFSDKERGLETSLVRMLPGASLPRHVHAGVEQLYILEGDCRVEDELLGPGDFHVADSGSVHERTYTVEGVLFLLVTERSDENDEGKQVN